MPFDGSDATGQALSSSSSAYGLLNQFGYSNLFVHKHMSVQRTVGFIVRRGGFIGSRGLNNRAYILLFMSYALTKAFQKVRTV